jgi:hypothetical protein
MKIISMKPTINKNNGQINISLPKKKLPISLRKNPEKIKSINVRIEDLDL